jgi:hypothetical protein
MRQPFDAQYDPYRGIVLGDNERMEDHPISQEAAEWLLKTLTEALEKMKADPQTQGDQT